MRVSLADGSVHQLRDAPCEAVAGSGNTLIIWEDSMRQGKLFENLDDLSRGKTLGASPHASRFFLDGKRLYAAWHSTDTVDIFELPNGTEVGSVKLEGWDDSDMGLSVTDDGRIVIVGQRGKRGVFDGKTGAKLTSESLGDARNFNGLACISSP